MNKRILGIKVQRLCASCKQEPPRFSAVLSIVVVGRTKI